VRTTSGAIAVQIVYSYQRGAEQTEHIGSAHDDAQLKFLNASPDSCSRPAKASWTWDWS
jgi:hypothetical protein